MSKKKIKKYEIKNEDSMNKKEVKLNSRQIKQKRNARIAMIASIVMVITTIVSGVISMINF
jgi:hypothetical protein